MCFSKSKSTCPSGSAGVMDNGYDSEIVAGKIEYQRLPRARGSALSRGGPLCRHGRDARQASPPVMVKAYHPPRPVTLKPQALRSITVKSQHGSPAHVKYLLSKYDRDDYVDSEDEDGYESEDGGIKIDYGQIARIDRWIEVVRECRAREAAEGPYVPEKPTLLTLPCEIRLEILKYLLVTQVGNKAEKPGKLIVISPSKYTLKGETLDYQITRWDSMGKVRNDLHPQIARTCKTLYHESMDILYRQNCFRAQFHEYQIMRWFSRVRGFDLIRTFSLRANHFHPKMAGLPPRCETLIIEGVLPGMCGPECLGFHTRPKWCLCRSAKPGTKRYHFEQMKRVLELMKGNGLRTVKFMNDGIRGTPVHPNLVRFIKENF
ncbi:hypothetical protein K490DRAFT_55991 [Saccharata proteae CBS 121410]|uniref:Uncharacterized protein n=1 Tax=Saccharata proteae CBS 121410 TaxID=1314787 RepID=A0A9P4LZY5_9PEZI|nr:hypothetical protein K490DRAFT_55991 [Saccharata proteae CBS 121410]